MSAHTVWDGIAAHHVLIGVTALLVCRPSLVPRSAAGQLLAVIGSLCLITPVAWGADQLIGAPPGTPAGASALVPSLAWAVGAATTAVLLTVLIHQSNSEFRARLVTGARGAATLLAAVAATSTALAGIRLSLSVVGRHHGLTTEQNVANALAAAVGGAAAIALGRIVIAQRRLAARSAGSGLADSSGRTRWPGPLSRPSLVMFLATVAAGFAVVALAGQVVPVIWAATGYLTAAGWPAPLAGPAVVVTGVAVVSGAGVAAVACWGQYLQFVDSAIDPRFAAPPADCIPNSGTTDIWWASLGPGGRRFLCTASNAARIATVTRTTAPDPIRVYVGLRSRWTPRALVRAVFLGSRREREQQVEQAMDELRARGALDRSVLVVATPTGSGSVDGAAIASFEYLTAGDCATVVLRYSLYPSFVALLTGQTGRKLYRLFYRRLAHELAGRAGPSPRVFLYGESLGALAGQDALRNGDVAVTAGAAGSLPIAGAIWTGTPGSSRWRGRQRRFPSRAVAWFAGGTTPTKATGDRSDWRIFLLEHSDDPVTAIDRSMLYAPAEVPAGLPRPWLPVVSFFHLVADTMGALGGQPAAGQARSHDYRANLPMIVSVALGREASNQLVVAVEDAVRSDESDDEFGPIVTSAPPGVIPPVAALTELRVHGVGNELPEVSLDHPVTHQVAGDDLAGFYRCGSRGSPVAAAPLRLREAYAWGALTDGLWRRILWVIFLPFAVTNVSAWMAQPFVRDAAGKVVTIGSAAVRFRWLRWSLTALHRVLALTQTLVLTVTLWGVSGYLVGWSCSAASGCSAAPGLLSGPIVIPGILEFTLPLPDEPGPRTAVTLLPVLLAILGLWALGVHSRRRFEDWPQLEHTAGNDPTPQTRPTPRGFWQVFRGGGVAVARLQSLHVAASMALLAALATYPDSGETPLWIPAVGGILLLATFAAIVPNRLVGRPFPAAHRPARRDDDWFDVGVQGLVLAAVALLAVAAVAVTWSGDAGTPAAGAPPPLTTLPGFSGTFAGLFLLQIALLGMLCVLLAIRAPHRGAPWRSGYAPALRGWAPLAVAGMGVLVEAAFSAGLLLVAARATGAWRAGAYADLAVIPTPVVYAATSVSASVCAGAVTVLAMVLWTSVMARGLTPAIIVDYGRGGPFGAPPDATSQQADAAERRRAKLAKQWAWGWMVDHAPIAALLIVAGAAGGLVLAWWSRRCGDGRSTTACGEVADMLISSREEGIFVWFLATFTTMLLTFTYHAIRGSRNGLIRTLWGVTTFWPRVAQPFAPGCYAERAVPELVHRVESLLRPPPDGRPFDYTSQSVILVGYSQGSVIAAAALEMIDEELLPQVALLTCGSPLRRLYARYFPAFFNWETIGVAADAGPAHRLPRLARSGRWRNVYRASDLIGSYVHVEVPPGRADTHTDSDVDRRILDPTSFGPQWGDFALPPTLAHTGYFADDRLATAVDDLANCFAAEAAAVWNTPHAEAAAAPLDGVA